MSGCHHAHDVRTRKGCLTAQALLRYICPEKAVEEKSEVQVPEHRLKDILSPRLEELKQWQVWAQWMANLFHRSSSAVEGRNGWLSQMYHNGRGLTVKRLQALTVIHNFGIERADCTTTAERFFGTKFPDLFEWLIDQMGELPLPRKSRERSVPNPLNIQAVPA